VYIGKIVDYLKEVKEERVEGKNTIKFFISYTIVFVIMSCVVFSWWIATDRTFVFRNDGWDQHFKALVYYGRYLREIAKTLIFEHQLIIPSWDFAIGEGSDIVFTFKLVFKFNDCVLKISVYERLYFSFLRAGNTHGIKNSIHIRVKISVQSLSLK